MENNSWLEQLCKVLWLHRVFTWMRCFGHAIPKPTYLLYNTMSSKQLWRVGSVLRELKRKAEHGQLQGMLQVFVMLGPGDHLALEGMFSLMHFLGSCPSFSQLPILEGSKPDRQDESNSP